jgi:protein gp37
MSENTKIEWCDHTFNPWTGCAKVSPGCVNCYAEGWAKRSGIVKWGKGEPRRRTSEIMWKLPLKWNRDHRLLVGTSEEEVHWRPRVFCASLADWLDNEVPIEWLLDLLELIRITPYLDWLLLTKRPENFRKRIFKVGCYAVGEDVDNKPLAALCYDWLDKNASPSNVWIGTTVEDQHRANIRIPQLLDIPAKVRFLSCEPLLGKVDLRLPCAGTHHGIGTLDCPRELHHHHDRKCVGRNLHWVITGGESGNGCRPFDASWARSLRDQSADSGVAFFMKQMGGARKPFPEIPDDLMIREFPLGGAR